jgi:hypothetical protein
MQFRKKTIKKASFQHKILAGSEQKLQVNLPEWAWFLIILLILAGLWVEAKVG